MLRKGTGNLLGLLLDERNGIVFLKAVQACPAYIHFLLFLRHRLLGFRKLRAARGKAFLTAQLHECLHRGVHEGAGELRILSRTGHAEDESVRLIDRGNIHAVRHRGRLGFLHRDLFHRAFADDGPLQFLDDRLPPAIRHGPDFHTLVAHRLADLQLAD